MKFKSIVAISLAGVLALSSLALSACSGSNSGSNSSTSTMSSRIPSATATFSDEELMSGKHHAVIEVEGYDPIDVTLDADTAPITVTNFVNLANEGYYNGLTFYRVVDNFCLQGGTLGNSASGNDSSLDTITGEFSSNGVSNPLADNFTKGTIAMARSSLPNSATSTFFITLANNETVGASLDGQYAAFGTIDDDGMVIVDQIVSDSLGYVDDANMGSISDEGNQPKIKRITILD